MHKVGLGLLVALSALLLSACGGEDTMPRPHPLTTAFPAKDARLYEKYDQTTVDRATVTVPQGTRQLAFQLDCRGTGKVEMRLGTYSSSITCPSTGRGTTVWEVDGDTAGRHHITVSVTKEGEAPTPRWSAALDILDPA